LDTVQKDLKPVYAGLNKYGKALDKVRFPVRATLKIES